MGMEEWEWVWVSKIPGVTSNHTYLYHSPYYTLYHSNLLALGLKPQQAIIVWPLSSLKHGIRPIA